ncbi:ThiF family adenylyltransferase [Hymenobacter rubripertinctus]|uniref:ThiF family adenylyltransferase n=1 Tax=Hymenobacter rubripertinctus TaxID=2029981 RepID=A0A418QNV7_9BACT|nr:ThiF family adenylyltransferase [Hymenobacter rubripertinctus]RIY06883.1 ThiF family adenylyltransferase [Hymenobacter rubripertinctus]
MSDYDEIALAQARVTLTGLAGVTVLGEWQRVPNSATWMLRLRLELFGAEPTAAVPLTTEWELVADFAQDLWGKITVHPALGEQGLAATFHHQMFNGSQHAQLPCRNGHICTSSWLGNLAKSRNAVQLEPSTTIERLCWHVERALQWLAAAAKGELVQDGDAFELPDFGIEQQQVSATLIYQEDEGSFARWQQEPSRSGLAWIVPIRERRGYVAMKFLDARGIQPVHVPEWGKVLSTPNAQQHALWVRLDEIPVVHGWQAPATMQELTQALAAQGLDLQELLAPLWKRLRLSPEVLLLLGTPIPKKVGEAPYRYHWQALQLAPPVGKGSDKSRMKLLRQHLLAPHSLRWVKQAENWHADELQSRGRLPQRLCDARILLLGAGALGSVLAEQLVRMGVRHMTVVDGQVLEGGNLVRHVLGLHHLFDSKAVRLADHLNLVNPLAQIVGLPLGLPTSSAEFEKAATEVTIIIDATGEDNVLRMVPMPSMQANALFVSCSLSLYAQQLFFYAQRVGSFEKAQFDRWFEPYRIEQNELAQQIELPRGAGCWHPLTPAPLNRIAGLAGVAVELLQQVSDESVALPAAVYYDWQVPALARTIKAKMAP